MRPVLDYSETFDPALPGRFEARLDEQIERIEVFPESGAILYASYGWVLLKRFPFMAVHLVGNDRIDVLALVNIRRDPASTEETVPCGPMASERFAHSRQEVSPRPIPANDLNDAFAKVRALFQRQPADDPEAAEYRRHRSGSTSSSGFSL